MLIVFIMLAIAAIISVSFWRGISPKKFANGALAFGITNVICLAILAGVWGGSYATYLECRTFFDGTKEQYASAVTMYSNYAEIDLKSAALTDLKYQGYQENIAKFISNLRNKIIRYNRQIISKRVMAKNPFFNWLIIRPDEDMLIIKMTADPSAVANE